MTAVLFYGFIAFIAGKFLGYWLGKRDGESERKAQVEKDMKTLRLIHLCEEGNRILNAKLDARIQAAKELQKRKKENS
jgi:hypothetical protein